MLEKLIAMIAEKQGIAPEKITATTGFMELGLDSLDTVELVMSLEDEFGISLEMNESIQTVGDVAAMIEKARA